MLVLHRDSEIAPTDCLLMVGGNSDSRLQTGRDSEIAPTDGLLTGRDSEIARTEYEQL